MSWTEAVLQDLTAAGHRLTGPRRHILDSVLRAPGPFTAEELLAQLAHEGVPVGRATVYRTLELLQAHQWLRLVHRPSGEHGYVLGKPGHQHHLVCRACGAVIVFEDCELEPLLRGLTERLNFRIESHWLELVGLCSSCRVAQ